MNRYMLVAVAVFMAGCGFTSTSPGESVVFSRFGEVAPTCYPAGFYLYNPFTTSVYHVDVKVQAFKVDKAAAVTRDLQEIHTDMVLTFSIDPSKCHDLIRQVGADFHQRIITPAVQEILKAATAHFAVEKVIQERPLLKAEMVNGLKTRLAPYFITVHDVALTNFAFTPSFAAAVERKQVEEQNVQREEFVRLQRVKQGEQFLALAEGQAKANRLLQDSLRASPELLQMKALDRWNGTLPQVTSGAVPFIKVIP